MRRGLALALCFGLATLAPAPAWAADRDVPKAEIQGVADRDLRRQIEDAVGTVERLSLSRFDARRRANQAAEQAVEVLRSEGFYDYEITPDATGDDPPRAVVKIDPGPRYRIGKVSIDLVPAPDDRKTSERAAAALGLNSGDPGRAADVIAAEGRAVSTLNRAGYADAKAAPRRVVVDHADHTVNPSFVVAAGSLVRLDGLQIQTSGRSRAAWLKGLRPWREGDPYSPEKVAELERRLLDTQVYQQVTVSLADPEVTDDAGRRAVVVSLADRPRATIEAAVGYSTTQGFGLDLVYNRYNVLGRGDTTSFLVRYAQIDRRLSAQMALPHWSRPGQTLTVGADAYDQTTPAYRRTGADIRADLKRRFGKTSFLDLGLAAEYDRNRQVEFNTRTGVVTPVDVRLAIVTASAVLNLDRSDNPLDPRRGWKVAAETDPTFVTGDRPITFLRTSVQGSTYLPLDRNLATVLAARLRFGSILNGSLASIPIDRRLYSGGAGSVRGYPYQGVGPHLPNTQPLGGLGLIEASLELRRRITQQWGAVAFVDAGSVSERAAPDLSHLSTGIGAGVRYILPFAPIRADIGFPLNRARGQPAWALYVSIGQAF